MAIAEPQPVTAPRPRYRKPNGKLVGHKAVIARALMAEGATVTEAARKAGIGRNTAAALRDSDKFTCPEHVELVRQHLRDKATLRVDSALDHISDTKLKKAKLKDLSSVVRALAPLAGIAEPSHIDTQINVLNQYAAEAGPRVIESVPSEPVVTT